MIEKFRRAEKHTRYQVKWTLLIVNQRALMLLNNLNFESNRETKHNNKLRHSKTTHKKTGFVNFGDLSSFHTYIGLYREYIFGLIMHAFDCWRRTKRVVTVVACNRSAIERVCRVWKSQILAVNRKLYKEKLFILTHPPYIEKVSVCLFRAEIL